MRSVLAVLALAMAASAARLPKSQNMPRLVDDSHPAFCQVNTFSYILASHSIDHFAAAKRYKRGLIRVNPKTHEGYMCHRISFFKTQEKKRLQVSCI